MAIKMSYCTRIAVARPLMEPPALQYITCHASIYSLVSLARFMGKAADYGVTLAGMQPLSGHDRFVQYAGFKWSTHSDHCDYIFLTTRLASRHFETIIC